MISLIQLLNESVQRHNFIIDWTGKIHYPGWHGEIVYDFKELLTKAKKIYDTDAELRAASGRGDIPLMQIIQDAGMIRGGFFHNLSDDDIWLDFTKDATYEAKLTALQLAKRVGAKRIFVQYLTPVLSEYTIDEFIEKFFE
jgi:hypothetical protein